jgi:lipoate-protein ligase A
MIVIETGTPGDEQAMIERRLGSGVAKPSLACWKYDAAGFLLGRGQRPAPELLARAADARIEVAVRASGGGAVIAGPWMPSLTLLLPPDHELAQASLPASYRVVGAACQRALVRLGVSAEIAAGPPAGSSTDAELGWVCFAGISHGELTGACGRKLLGIAQVRRRTGIAICVGVLLERPDWESLLDVWLGCRQTDLVARLENLTVTCGQLAGRGPAPTTAGVFDAMHDEFRELGLAA